MTRIFVVLWSSLSIVDLLKSEFLPFKLRHWQIVDYFPHWSWAWWLSLSSFFVFLATWLGAYKESCMKHKEIKALQPQFSELTIEIKEVFVIPSRRSDVFVLLTVTNETNIDTVLGDCWALVDSDTTYHLQGPLDDLKCFSLTQVDWSESEAKRVFHVSELEDLNCKVTRANPLKRGLPATGWLHFKVEANSPEPDLDIKAIKGFSLWVKNPLKGSLGNGGTKQANLRNPSTSISPAVFYP